MDTSLFSNSVSKRTAYETGAYSEAYFSDAKASRSDAISDERIVRGDVLRETYTVLSEEIPGGMGSVWRVHHNGWNTDLAMKRPQPRFFAEAGPKRKQRFIEECENWIGLGLHPDIVSCYYVREIGGVPTIFSEWMDGGSLSDCIRDGTLYRGSADEVGERILDIAIQAAQGLHYAHENGLIHQDMKPGNLLLTGGWDAKVADFGLATARSQLESETGEPGVSGYTLAYCPAEQAAHETAGRWMDVYAWALTVLEMYAGRRLWETGAEAKDRFGEILSQCARPVPEKLVSLLEACLRDRPAGFGARSGPLAEMDRETAGVPYGRTAIRAADTAGALNNRALSFLDIGMPEMSEKTWDKALEEDPNHVDTLFNRELYRVRSKQKLDTEAIRDLRSILPAREAGADRLIAGEYPQEPLKPMYRFTQTVWNSTVSVGSIYACAVDGRRMVVYGRNRKGLYLGICPLEEAAGEKEIHPLDDYLKDKKGVLECALFRDGSTAVFLFRDARFSLYDIHEKREIRITEKIPEFRNFCFRTRLWVSPDGTRLAAASKDPDDRRVFWLSLPDFRILSEVKMEFTGFLPDGQSLLRGKVSRGKEALYLADPDGNTREVFPFEKTLERKTEYGREISPFVSYVYKGTGESFFLDGSFQKHPMDPGILPEKEEILFHDPGRHLLATLRKSRYVCFWDLERQALIRSVEIGAPNFYEAVWYPAADELLIWSAAQESIWQPVSLPRPPCPSSPAMWRLSGIESTGRRLEKQKKMAELAAQFEACRKAGDVPGMITAKREYSDNAVTREEAGEIRRMQDVLDRAAKRGKIRTVRMVRNDPETPEEPGPGSFPRDGAEAERGGEPLPAAADNAGRYLVTCSTVTEGTGYRTVYYTQDLKTGRTAELERTERRFTAEDPGVGERRMAFLADGTLLAAPFHMRMPEEQQAFALRRYSPETGKLLNTIPLLPGEFHTGDTCSFTLNPEKTLIFAYACADGFVRRTYSMCLLRADGTMLYQWQDFLRADGVLFFPGERYLLLRYDNQIAKEHRDIAFTIWDLKEKREIFSEGGNIYRNGVYFLNPRCEVSADGRTVFQAETGNRFDVEYDYLLPGEES